MKQKLPPIPMPQQYSIDKTNNSLLDDNKSPKSPKKSKKKYIHLAHEKIE